MEMFDAIVGQPAAKRKLGFYARNFKSSQVSPHIMFVAPKGMGKSMIAREYAKNLSQKDSSSPKTFVEINCSSIKNVRQLIDGILLPFAQDKEVTIFLDEASELPNDVTMMLLTVLNPNKTNQNTFLYDDFRIDVNFARHTFLFATSEAHLVFHALMDRLTRVDLENYSQTQLSEILQENVKDVTFEQDLLMDISSTLRGNARQAQKMAADIGAYTKSGGNNFSRADWKTFVEALDVLPFGLNRTELRVLQILSERREVKLTNLAAMLGMSRSAVQKDAEIYLQHHNLMTINPLGRSITLKGQEYLRELNALHVALWGRA
jgi:Holliday junction resolvasome RuvABC ATP-dependent DNA helicase subunit